MHVLILLFVFIIRMVSTLPLQKVITIVAQHEPNINSIEGQELEYIKLMEKIDTESLPIYEFSRDIKRLLITLHDNSDDLDKTNSIHKLHQLYNRYLDKLRDYYYMLYVNSFSDSSREYTANTINDTKNKIYSECENAMKNALESDKVYNDVTQSWTYEGPLQELKDDLDSHSTRILQYFDRKGTNDQNIAPKKFLFLEKIYQKIPFLNRHRKRVKWLVAQIILFSLNFIQNEIHRKSSYHAANKRLAEIPAFPML